MAETFPGILAFAFMVALLFLGTVLRAAVPLFQTFLIPASLIGGVIGFVLISGGGAFVAGWFSPGWSFAFQAEDFSAFAFHFFTLSFISLCLTAGSPDNAGRGGVFAGGFWLTAVWTASLVLQGLVGLGVIWAYNAVSGDTVSELMGLLVAHGYTQGPGQALAYASIWEEQFGLRDAVSVGLIYASLGFLTTFVLGVPVARWAIRRGLNANPAAAPDDDFLRGVYRPPSGEALGKQITHSSNVDSLAYHVGLLGIVYLLTDIWLRIMGATAGAYGLTVDMSGAPSIRLMGEGMDDMAFVAPFSILFSYNLFFVHGLIMAVLVRRLIDMAGLGAFLDRGTQNMITGASVDFMVIATVMSIKAAVLAALLVPVLLVSLAVTVATGALCYFAASRGGGFAFERALTAFGCCCGSTGTGLLLLRIMDPDFRTPVSRELAVFNIAIIFTTLHVLLFMVPQLPAFDTVTIIRVYAGTLALSIAVLVGMNLWTGKRTG